MNSVFLTPTRDRAQALELAQALSEHLAITPNDWHRLKANRSAQAGQHLAAAIVFLLKDQPQEAIAHLQQAEGWLDRSITAPPCPSHGTRHPSPSSLLTKKQFPKECNS